MENLDDKLYKKINKKNNKFIMFGLSFCGYSNAAIKYLKDKKIKFKYYEIDKYYDIFFKMLNQLVENHPELAFDTNHKTFPVIFLNGKFIGGYSNLILII